MKKQICILLAFVLSLLGKGLYGQCSTTLTTSGSTTLCTNLTNTVMLTASASPGGGTFGWLPGPYSGPTIVVSPTATTIYTVTVTYTNGCTASKTLAVTVATNCCTQTPTLSITGNTLYCSNLSTSDSLHAFASPGGGSFNWQPGGYSGPNIAVNPTASTIYTLTVTYTNGCTASKTLAVTVSTNCCTQTPTLSITGNTLYCSNLSTSDSLHAFASPGGGSFNWQPGGYSGPNIAVSPTASTIYTVTVTYTNGCTASQTLAVTVMTNCCTQTPTLTANSKTLCINATSTVALSASASPGGGTFGWLPGPYSGPGIVVSPTATTIYTVTVTYTNGCSASKTLAVTVSTNCCTQTPTLSITGNTLYCSNLSTSDSLHAFASPGGGSFNWQPGGYSGPNIAVSPTASTIYTVTVTYTNGCTASQTLAVTVMTNCCTQTPTLTANSKTLCINATSTVALSASASPGGGTFGWLPGPYSGPGIVVSPTATTIYTVTVTYTNGCSASKTLAVTVSTNCCTQTPTLSITGNTLYCSNLSTSDSLHAFASPGGGSFNWQPGSYSGPNIAVSPTASTIYTVTVTYTNGCTASQTLAVTVMTNCCTQTPTLTTSGSASICTNVTTTLALSAGASPGGGSFSWQPGGYSGASVVVTPTASTIYTITVTYTNGCSASTTLAVTVVTLCCPSSTISVLTPTLLNGVTLSGPVVIMNDITIGGGATTIFQNGAFIFAPNVKVTIASASQLQLNGAHLYACGLNMWKGIDLLGTANISGGSSSGNVTLIEDAITAINLDNANSPAALPIDLTGVIFNKNYQGINVSNGSITSLNLRLMSCVFTSRNLPFSATSWPGSSTGSPDLRWSLAGATAGLASPYTLQSYAAVNLKNPYNFQPGHIGINISNMGNTTGAAPAPGLNINSWYAMTDTTFNLFDNIGTGINVRNAGLTTMNNVFQNMLNYSIPYAPFTAGGSGIRDTISSLMNARLSLIPQGVTPGTNFGNRFWNCYYGVEAYNVYDFNIEYGLFRSTQTIAGGGGFAPGYRGVFLNSNRFRYKMRHNEFNDVNTAISIPIVSGNFNMGGGTSNGIYGDSLVISQNYFGPQVSSSTPLGSNFLNLAIEVNTPIGAAFSSAIIALIQSNKIDRAFRGIYISAMGGCPVEIETNLVYLTNDNLFSGIQRGISLFKTQGSVRVIRNNLSSITSGNPQITLVYCESNTGSSSPQILCNDLFSAYEGFEFNQSNTSTIWKGNTMRVLHMGMVLRNNGIIGTQGNTTNPIDNQWLGGASGWTGLGNFGTYTDGTSNAASSKLFVKTSALPWYPPNNSGVSLPTSYNASGNILISSSGAYVCPTVNAPTAPNNRMATADETSSLNGTQSDWQLDVFPNPTSGKLQIQGALETEILKVSVRDITGKLVLETSLSTSDHNCSLNLPFAQGIYLMEIRGATDQVMYKKIILNP